MSMQAHSHTMGCRPATERSPQHEQERPGRQSKQGMAAVEPAWRRVHAQAEDSSAGPNTACTMGQL